MAAQVPKAVWEKLSDVSDWLADEGLLYRSMNRDTIEA